MVKQLLLTALVLALCLAMASARIGASEERKLKKDYGTRGDYIVVFEKSVTDGKALAEQLIEEDEKENNGNGNNGNGNGNNGNGNNGNGNNGNGNGNNGNAYGHEKAKVKRQYKKVLNGVALSKAPPGLLKKLEESSAVRAIYPDDVVTASATQTGATWGLDRVDAITGLDNSYSWNDAPMFLRSVRYIFYVYCSFGPKKGAHLNWV